MKTINSMVSLDEMLTDLAHNVLKNRMETWMKYKFEKEMLPELMAEVTERVRIELIANPNIPEEIALKIRYIKEKIAEGSGDERLL